MLPGEHDDSGCLLSPEEQKQIYAMSSDQFAMGINKLLQAFYHAREGDEAAEEGSEVTDVYAGTQGGGNDTIYLPDSLAQD